MNNKSTLKDENHDFLLQAQEVEELVGVHRISLHRWAKKGIAPKPQKIGGRWFWRNSEIQQLILGTWKQNSP